MWEDCSVKSHMHRNEGMKEKGIVNCLVLKSTSGRINHEGNRLS